MEFQLRLFNAKLILSRRTMVTHREVHNFPLGICPKVNVIARLEFELTFYDSPVPCFTHYTTKTPQPVDRILLSLSRFLELNII